MLKIQFPVNSTSTVSYASATPPASYTATTAVESTNYNALIAKIEVAVAEAGKVATIKPQWSDNGTDWWDEPLAVNGVQSGTDAGGNLEYAENHASRVLSLALDNARFTAIRFNRMARFMRFQVKSDATTGEIEITVTPQCN